MTFLLKERGKKKNNHPQALLLISNCPELWYLATPNCWQSKKGEYLIILTFTVEEVKRTSRLLLTFRRYSKQHLKYIHIQKKEKYMYIYILIIHTLPYNAKNFLDNSYFNKRYLCLSEILWIENIVTYSYFIYM